MKDKYLNTFITLLLLPILFFNINYCTYIENECNNNVAIKDWGFFDFAQGDDTYWKVSVNDLNYTTVTEIEQGFSDTNIFGFFGLKITSPYYDCSISLNNTVQAIDADGLSDYSLYFRLSAVASNFIATLYLDTFEFHKISTTSTNYFQEEILIEYPVGYLDGLPHNLSINIYFTNTDTVYLDDIKLVRVLNSSLLKHDIKDIYVSSDNGNDISGDGSFDKPFSSVQTAIYFVGENSTIYVLPGTYCGLGNSWIDPSVIPNAVTILAYDSENKPIFTGMEVLNIITYQAWGVNPLIIDGLILSDPNSRPNGALVYITGISAVYFMNSEFYQTTICNQTIFLNYLNSTSFVNCTFKSSTSGYFIQIEGVFGDDSLEIRDSNFYTNNPLDILEVSSVNIVSSNFYKSPTITQDGCEIIGDIVTFFNVTNSYFEVIFCLTETESYFKNVTIQNIHSDFDSSILLQASTTLMESVTITNVTVATSIQVFQGWLELIDCNFQNTVFNIDCQTANLTVNATTFSGGGVAISMESSLATIYNSTFYHVNSFIAATQSTITMTSSLIYNSSFDGNSIFDSVVYSYSNTFTKNSYDLIQLSLSYFNDQGSSIINNNGAFIIAKNTPVTLNFTTFFENHDTSQFTLIDGTSLYGTNLNVTKNHAPNGAFLSIQDNSEATIATSRFSQNRATQQGGCIYMQDDSSLILDTVTADNNYAQQGGVIISLCSGVNCGSIEFRGGLYDSNSALDGAVLYYIQNPPSISNNTVFRNNVDSVGGDVALGKAYVKLTNTSYLPFSVESGYNNFRLTFQLYDADGNALLGNKTCPNQCQLYFFVGGTIISSKTIANDGSCTFDNLILTGELGTAQNIIVYSNLDTIQAYRSSINFNNCTGSSVPNVNNELCVPCDSGTYGMNGKTCSICPENISCLGGNNTVAEVGYWLYINQSQQILEAFQCPPDVCLSNNTCAEYTTGPLCSECVNGYYNCGSGCKYSDSIDIIVVILKVIIFSVLVLAQQVSSDSSGLIPIALYFMQTLVVLSSGVKFSLFSIVSGASSSSTRSSSSKSSILSYLNDCIGPFDFYWNHYFVLSQPIILILILVAIIFIEFLLRVSGILYKIPLIKNLVSNSHQEFKNRQFSAFIKVCMNSYGPLITEMLLILFCSQIGSYELLTSNPGVQCQGSEYSLAKKVTWGLIPIIILFPSVIFVLLYQSKDKLDDPSVERKLGVFYLKYKRKFYFWDVLLLLKRFTIVILSLLEFDSNIRSISLVFLCLFYLFVQIKYEPFLSGKDNYLETISLTLLFISCIYLDNGLWEITEQWILLGSVVVFGIAAIKLQGNYYWNEVKKVVQPIIQKIQNLCSCCFSNLKKTRERKRLHNYDSEDDDQDSEYTDESDLSQKYIGKIDQRNLLGSSINSTILSSSYSHFGGINNADPY